MTFQIAGTILSLLGIFSLYAAWQKKGRDWPRLAIAWALVTAAIISWSQTSGIDKGPALGIVVVTLSGLLAVAVVGLRSPEKMARPARAARITAVHKLNAWPVAIRALVIILAGLIVSVAASTAIFMGSRSAGLEHTANLTLTMFSFPMLWGVIATYTGYSQSAKGRAVVLAGIAAASICVIALGMKGG